MNTYRILVTGSRDWPYAFTVHEALLAEVYRAQQQGFDSVVLIHGKCPTGPDNQAHMIWTEAYPQAMVPFAIIPPEVYPGEDFPTFKDRNQFMVDKGANVCLAFATKWASGTGQTARMARRAGIRTRDYGVSTT